MKKFILLFLAAFCLVFTTNQGYASSTKIVAEGRYILGDNDTRTQAKDAAVKDAMRIAVEKAGVYVESYSETNNCQLTKDQVRMAAAGIVKVMDQSIDFVDNGTVCRAVIYVDVDTDNMNVIIQDILNGKAYESNSSSSDSSKKAPFGYDPVKIPGHEITGIVIDYSDFVGDASRILHHFDVLKAMDGRVVYRYSDNSCGEYFDWDYNRIKNHVGDNPVTIKPVFFEKDSGYDYYWRNPVISNEDADYIFSLLEKHSDMFDVGEHPICIYGYAS